MKAEIYKRVALALSTAGVLFSGYLSGTKFFTKTCAFNESCPYFLGYPACYFGFALFLTLFITSLLLFLGRAKYSAAAKANFIFSGLGIIFAGYFAYPEIMGLIDGTFTARFLGLSTCVYGLVFFLAVFVISAKALKGNK